MASLHFLDWAVITVYFLAMAWLGFSFSKKNKDTEEYFVGGRRFKGWVVGLSLVGTSISSVSFLAYPADAYYTAWIRMLLNFLMPVAGAIAIYLFIPFYRAGRKTSAYQYLGLRFGEGIRMYGSIAYIIGQFVRLAVVLFLVSKLLNTMLGWDIWVCIVVAGIVVSVYTIAGGIDAVVWTDVIQTLVLIFGGLVIFWIILRQIPGGIGLIIDVAVEDGKLAFSEREGDTLVPLSWGWSLSKKTGLMILLLGLVNWLQEFGTDQNVVQRYCGAVSDKEARKAVWWTVWARLPIWALFMFLGTSMYVFFKFNPTVPAMEMLSGAQKPEGILPYFVMEYMPPGLSGLVIAAVVAAAMSSLDSSMNAISAVFVTDMYRNRICKDKDEKHYLFVSRLTATVAAVVMIVFATVLAYSQTKTIQDTVLILTSIIGSGLLGLFSFGFFTKMGDSRSVGLGVVATICFTIYVLLGQNGFVPMPAFDLYYTTIVANILMFVVSFVAALVIKRSKTAPSLDNLTVWTMVKSK
ncbi:Na(+)/glucose symporter [Limihaloglobus sulfuriphilus]|uniref:Na(+)/glucose symporter n=1 Tax=Limihaloglobus sulfuriphilus TaxID=1851148 RepID=A0A1Q2MEK7_9BACT|nr:sodium:solute symporter [Limihaloglobus sulfuriphilus]AQQ71135.1 Na(+)/glucose symporter [Limihaloglobus sulfuriphilus]